MVVVAIFMSHELTNTLKLILMHTNTICYPKFLENLKDQIATSKQVPNIPIPSLKVVCACDMVTSLGTKNCPQVMLQKPLQFNSFRLTMNDGSSVISLTPMFMAICNIFFYIGTPAACVYVLMHVFMFLCMCMGEFKFIFIFFYYTVCCF